MQSKMSCIYFLSGGVSAREVIEWFLYKATSPRVKVLSCGRIGILLPFGSLLLRSLDALDRFLPPAACQFTSEEYQRFLEAHQVICSMSAVGSCADNAADESFFGVLKRERVNRQHYQTRAEARADIFDYIGRCHNPRQRRRLDRQQQKEGLFTQPSVISG